VDVPEGYKQGCGFEDACDFDKAFRSIAENLNSAEILYPAVGAFSQNMERVHFLPRFILETLWGYSIANRCLGSMSVPGGFFIPFITGIPTEDALQATGSEEFVIQYHTKLRTYFALLNQNGIETHFDAMWRKMCNLVEHVSMDPDEVIAGPGIDALYFSMVLNSYAAFETLASDMWVAVLNWKPSLYDRFVKSEDTKVTVGDMAKFGFDLRTRMGDFLRETNTSSFGSLNAIKRSYMSVFGQPIEAAFTGHHINRTEKTRHLIAHRAGLIDNAFIEDSKKWNDFGPFIEGDYLRLHGSQVRNLVDACVKTAVDLIKAVDEWISRNEKPPRTNAKSS